MMKLKKGDILKIKIEKIVCGGEGLGFYEGYPIFVPMSVVGDVLKIQLITVKKDYGRGLIKTIIIPSLDRISDLTKISFEDFQGCDFGMINYEAQLKFKKEIVEETVRRIGKNKNIKIENTLKSPKILNYRNKIIEPFSLINEKIATGFFKRKTHDIFEVDNNQLNSILGNKIIKILKNILNQHKITVYNEKIHIGLLRHIMIRTNSANEAMVVLVINSKKIPEEIVLVLKNLKEKFEEIVSIYVSLNTKKTNVALGNKNICIFGNKNLKEKLSEIVFNISPTSFFQINLEQTKNLYNLAIGLFDNIENKVIVDAYAGTGTIGMLLSKKAKYIYSIEIHQQAVSDGIKTAMENGITNIKFICGDMNSELNNIVQKETVDAIIFDPPRKGIDEINLLNIIKTAIKEIVYISCNPATFSRDIKILEQNDYKLTKVIPVDMFPQTSHIEVVGKLVKI